jgi:1-phosphatidylinositol-4-phosphate 5-kinase
VQGSAIGREYPEEKAKDNPRAILKDLNFLSRDRVFALGPEKKALFEEQLRRDTELMQRLGIMDYSLLTGIHNLQRGNIDNLRDGLLTVFQVSVCAGLNGGRSCRKADLSLQLSTLHTRASTPQPDTVKMRRKPTLIKSEADATALRKAVQRSDPKALSETNRLPDQDNSERRLFLFYQDEGGMRATNANNEDVGVIYYLVRHSGLERLSVVL